MGVHMHMMYVRVHDMHDRHLAHMRYMWCMSIILFIWVHMYENRYKDKYDNDNKNSLF